MVNAITADPAKLRGFKIRIFPNEEQKERIKRISDLYRFTYNRTVAILFMNYEQISEEEYESYKTQGYSLQAIHRLLKGQPKGSFINFVNMCKIMGAFRNATSWMKDIPINIARYAMRNVYQGYSKFFKGCNPHPPKFRNKSKKQSFACRGERVRFENGFVKIEGIETMIPHESASFPRHGRLYNCTVTYDGYENYYLSFQTEMIEAIQYYPQEGPIGIDLGMRTLVTLSDGTMYKPLNTKRLEKRRRRKESRVNKDKALRIRQSRQAKTKLEDVSMSKRMQKRYVDYRRAVTHIWNKRNTYVHQITREIVNRHPSAIVMEDLKVMKMMGQFKGYKVDLKEYLFFEIRRQIEYKARWAGIPVIIADHWYPSSQLCSNCGNRQKIGKNKIYHCPVCGLTIDRDINAALNLRSLAT